MTLVQQLPIGFELLQNAALLALGAIGYCQIREWLQDRLPQPAELAMFGFVFGILGVLSILANVELVPGVRVDFRTITVLLASLFGGVEAGLVTLVIVQLFGAVVGYNLAALRAVIVLSAFAWGTGVAVVRRRRGSAIGWADLLCVGLAQGATSYGLAALWPQTVLEAPVMRNLALLWLTLLMLAVVSLGGIVLFFEHVRQLRRTLRERDADFQSIMDNSPVSIFLKDRYGRFRLFNRRFAEWAGRRPEEIRGKRTRDFCPPPIVEQSEATDREVLDHGRGTSYEWSANRSDRDTEYFNTVKFPVRDERGAVVGIGGLSLDITAQKRADAELHTAQTRLQAIMDSAPLAIFLKDREGRFRLINRCYTDWFGDRPEDVYGRTAAELYPPSIAKGAEERDRDVLERGRVTQ